jgi:hypothetical protein
MLLEALVACAGGDTARGGDGAGAGGVGHGAGRGRPRLPRHARGGQDAPVGFSDIRLRFDLDTTADADQVATLLKLTERYCVVLQTLTSSPTTSVTVGP